MPKRKRVKLVNPLIGIQDSLQGVHLEIDVEAMEARNNACDIIAYQSLKHLCETSMFPEIEEELEELRAELLARGLDVDTLIEVEIDETER